MIYSFTAIAIVAIICATIIVTNWRKFEYEKKIEDLTREKRECRHDLEHFRNLYYNRANDFIAALDDNVILITQEKLDELKDLLNKMEDNKQGK